MHSYLSRQAVTPGARTVIFTSNDVRAIAPRPPSKPPVSMSPPSSTAAMRPTAAWSGRARVLNGSRGARRAWRPTPAPCHDRDRFGSAAHRGGCACHVRRLEPDHPPCLPSGRQAGLVRGKRQPSWRRNASRDCRLPALPAGLGATGACLGDGAAKAVEALQAIGFVKVVRRLRAASRKSEAASKPLWSVKGGKGKAFVDYQNDVHLKDLGLAVREGYGHVELAKRYTTSGMATDQGKLSNINAIGILAEPRGVSPRRSRHHHIPSLLYACLLRRPDRAARAAVISSRYAGHRYMAGQRRMAPSSSRPGSGTAPRGFHVRERRPGVQSVDREVLNIRQNAGICDVSTLGKIEVFGRDAAAFLDRVYCNGFAKLPVGRARYGIMLREDGMIYDDGTTSRFAEDHFFMTTTTAPPPAC